jgi:NMD protein affecting ribosome stability and mRNA decay
MNNEYRGGHFVPPFEGNCHRCGKETYSFTMSWFSTESICLDCSDEESNHPDFKLAKDVEVAHCKNGNFNYPGIGWPGKDNRVLIDISALYPNTTLPINTILPIEEE